MKKEDYEKQIQELNEQALRLEKTMQTYRYLEQAKSNGHEFETHVHSSEFGKIDLIEVICTVSGANYLIEPKTPMQMEIPNDPRLFGDLAGKKLKDIEIYVEQPSKKTTETDEKPTLPLETEATESGTYKVDVSNIVKNMKGEE
tara:strand:- start:8590 stop:9021 length:432 start_codon:yes stop_codon:yes gene_type:complete